jgi:hypothetical protein
MLLKPSVPYEEMRPMRKSVMQVVVRAAVAGGSKVW